MDISFHPSICCLVEVHVRNVHSPLSCANSDNKSRGQFKGHGTNQHHQYSVSIVSCFDFVLLLMSRQLPGATRLDNGYWR